jgi:hypothetical protein
MTPTALRRGCMAASYRGRKVRAMETLTFAPLRNGVVLGTPVRSLGPSDSHNIRSWVCRYTTRPRLP